jgi:signal transduction histidine kinase
MHPIQTQSLCSHYLQICYHNAFAFKIVLSITPQGINSSHHLKISERAVLANAFKFTETGQICLRAIPKTNEPAIEISVTDTGIGIEPNRTEVLFEPFVQADGSMKRRYGGTGLGLTVCQRLVKLMGGKIWLESAGLGQGTQVSFTLPMRKGSGE